MIAGKALACFLAAALSSQAGEVVGWKAPLAWVARDLPAQGAGLEGKLTPPEPSVFFLPSDELMELRFAELFGQALALDWVVWNARSGMLVAKGEIDNLSRLEELLKLNQMPSQCRIVVELFDVPPGGGPPGGKLALGLSAFGRSGTVLTASTQGATGELKFEAGPISGPSGTSISLPLQVSGRRAGGTTLEATTLLHLSAGQPWWVAHDFEGTKGLDVVVTGFVELIDGTALQQTRWIQSGKEMLPLAAQLRPELRALGEAGFLVVRPFSPSDLGPDPAQPADPFAKVPEETNGPLESLKVVSTPEPLRSMLPHRMMDMHDWAGALMVDLKLDESPRFAAFDPLRQQLVVWFATLADADIFSQLFRDGCQTNEMIAATIDGRGQSRIVGKNGCKLYLARLDEHAKPLRALTVEPTLASTVGIIDLRLHYSNEKDASLSTLVTAAAGEPLELALGNQAGERSSLRICLEVLGKP